MKVLYVLERYPELSQTFVAQEVKALLEAGVQVRVAALARGAAGSSPAPAVWVGDSGLPQRLAATAKAVVAAPAASIEQLLRERSWPPPNGTRRIRGLLRMAPLRELAADSDHIHAHFATEATDLARLLSASTGRPFSFTAHAADAYSDPAALAINLEAATFARACSHHVAERLREAAPKRADSIVEIGVAVDVDAFSRSGPRAAGGPILAVGRLVEKKGLDDLIDVAAMGAFGDRELLIVGDGPLRLDLESRIRESGARADLLGALPPDRVVELMHRASIFALTPRTARDGDRDGLPAAIVEAMAAGLPVLATSQPGIPEVVDTQCGRLATPGDTESIAEQARLLLSMSAAELDAMGATGAARAREAHRPSAVAARLLALFSTPR